MRWSSRKKDLIEVSALDDMLNQTQWSESENDIVMKDESIPFKAEPSLGCFEIIEKEYDIH
jgi:hypothetical protein